MLFCFSGSLGSGKTFNMAKMAFYYSYKTGLPIYSNIYLNPDYFQLHYEKHKNFDIMLLTSFSDFKKVVRKGDGIVLLDEAYRIADSRLSMDKQNIQISQFFMFLRKLGLFTFFTAQSIHMLDKRIREIMIYLALCYKERDRFCFDLYDLQQLKKMKKYTLPKNYCEPYFGLYNTHEFIEEFKLPEPKEFEKLFSELSELRISYLNDKKKKEIKNVICNVS